MTLGFGNSFENASGIMNIFQKSNLNLADIFKTNDICVDVQTHLVHTFTILLLALSVASMGVLFHLWLFPIGGLLTMCVSLIPLGVITCEKDKSAMIKRSILYYVYLVSYKVFP